MCSCRLVKHTDDNNILKRSKDVINLMCNNKKIVKNRIGQRHTVLIKKRVELAKLHQHSTKCQG